MGALRCLVVDDDHFMRQGLAAGLRTMGGVEVVDEAGSLTEALAHPGPVDVVLLDLGLPGHCRRTAIRSVIDAWPEVKVLVITGHATGPDVVQAFGEGASGYVTKHVGPVELAQALGVVASGSSYVTPELAGHLLNAGFMLSDRERSVLRLVGRGLSNGEVADQLHLAEKTVENQIAAIRAKVGLLHRPRSELTRFALESDPACLLSLEEHD